MAPLPDVGDLPWAMYKDIINNNEEDDDDQEIAEESESDDDKYSTFFLLLLVLNFSSQFFEISYCYITTSYVSFENVTFYVRSSQIHQ